MLNTYSRSQDFILNHFKFILFLRTTFSQWFFSLAQAVTSQAESIALLRGRCSLNKWLNKWLNSMCL